MQNFQMFTIIWNMTGGGPVNTTTTLSVAVYRKAFVEYNFGVGSALGVLWLLVLFLATLAYNRINDRLTEANQ
jgi:multiple sugar transport system permease protein